MKEFWRSMLLGSVLAFTMTMLTSCANGPLGTKDIGKESNPPSNQHGGTADNIGQSGSGSDNVPEAGAEKHASKSSGLAITAPSHIVIVIEENHSYAEISGNKDAPYINSLMRQGANLTNYHGVEHPSQPNYLDLFSGSNQGVTSDSCPHTFDTPNLASSLIAAGKTFTGYAEDLPKPGYTGCANKKFAWMPGVTYARKHSPWVNFTNVPASDNQPWSAFLKDLNHLPTVSFVIPNLNHDMHNGSVSAGDKWLKGNLSSYVSWAMTHNSLLIVTFDEDDKSSSNQVATVLVGPMIRPGNYGGSLNHFNLLRTIEDLYGLPQVGKSAHADAILGIWKPE